MQPPQISENFDPEEMEAWLAEVELVHEKIKKLASQEENDKQFDDQDILKIRQQRLEAEKKKQEKLRQLQLEKEEIEKKGRKGKGQNKDYANFCQYCFLEYVNPTEKCYWCKRNTMTQAERYSKLMEKVEQYKTEKARKQDRKTKFELMEKTEKMLWKKSTFNHKKWEYYTSSEEEIESEPIVPKDDPNFKALEMDMEQRKKKREEDMKKAEELKVKGNKYFSQGEYEHAAWKYSEAIDLIKDNKNLWLNRALAYIKLNKNKKAINDCTKVLDFAEAFEEGFTKSKDSCFKAFARRALAFYNRDQLTEAINDTQEALKLFPDDKDVQILQKEIQAKMDHYQKLKEIQPKEDQETIIDEEQGKNNNEQQNSDQSNLTFIQIIDKFIAEDNIDLIQILKILKLNQAEATAYFFQKKGLDKILNIIKQNNDSLNNFHNLIPSLPALILQAFQEKNLIYQQEFLQKQNGAQIVIDKVWFLLDQIKDQQKSAVYDTVLDYIEALNIMDEEKPRIILQQNNQLNQNIYPKLFDRIISLYEFESELLGGYFSFCSNLCYGNDSLLKQIIFKDFNHFILQIIKIFGSNVLKINNLKMFNQLCNLLSNLLTDEKIRKELITKQYIEFFQNYLAFMLQLQFKGNEFQELKQNSMAVLVNLTYQITSIQSTFISKETSLIKILLDWLDTQKNQLVIERVLTVLSKTNYQDNIYLVNQYLKQYQSQSLRCLIYWLTLKSDKVITQLQTQNIQFWELLEELKQLLFSDIELIYCNSCNVIGMIIDIVSPIQGEKNACSFYNQMIPRLLTFVKDKTGNFRKNSAILLAKLTKDQKNLNNLRDLHGIEVLQSIIGKI